MKEVKFDHGGAKHAKGMWETKKVAKKVSRKARRAYAKKVAKQME